MDKRKVVGIDLGTTFSAIAHVDDHGDPEIVPNAESELITPSVIQFEEGLITVGTFAQANAVAVPEQVVEFVKREMGKSKEEFSKEFDGTKYSAEELSALILKRLKQDAEASLKTEITDAVITVPAYFRDAEREATRNAGKIAGLNVLQVLNEPTAAALAYGFDQLGKDQNVFVFDLGGGTFDVTIVKVSESKIETIATQGDHRLGGKDWDDRLIEYVAKTFEDEHGENPLLDPHTKQDIQQRAVSAKKELSQKPRARIMCSYNGNTRVVELTREKIEELTDGLVRRCQALCDLALIEGNMEWDDIDTVLLAGGSTRMPMVRKMIANISGTKINPHEVNPDEVVAIGAAIQATLNAIENGIEIRPLVIDKFLPPNGPTDEPIVIDVATHNLGHFSRNNKKENVVFVMIPKMESVPCEKVDTFYTIRENQTSVLFEIVEGLEKGVKKDEITAKGEGALEEFKVGECLLKLPSGLPDGTPIRTTYKYDENQILAVTAEGPNGEIASVTIERKILNDKEIEDSIKHIDKLKVE